MANVVGVYLHIPFCRSKCDYCDFYSMPAGDDLMDRYQKALLTQIKSMVPRLKGRTVDTIYIGGGTPSYYGEKRLRELLGYLQRHLSVAKNAEITVECNPDTVDLKSVVRLRKAGVNRISLGMQSADPDQLRCVHRVHDPQQVIWAVEDIRAAKIENLSLDLIYGLPGQSLDSWTDTIRAALALHPDHLSCYGLKVEEGTPLARRVDEEGDMDLPDGDSQADFYLEAVEQIQQAGFRQYEISNFARTGMESRHNLKYWMGREYAGFGPGAHSYLDGVRYAWPRDLAGYLEALEAGEPVAMAEKETVPPREQAREYLLLRMRTMRGIEEWEYRRSFGLNFEPISRRLEFFESHRWAEQSDHRWHFTPQGFLLSNTLIADLLDAQAGTLTEQQIDWEALRPPVQEPKFLNRWRNSP